MYVRRKGMAWSSLGLPDGFFTNQKKNNLGKFWRALDGKMLINFMAIFVERANLWVFWNSTLFLFVHMCTCESNNCPGQETVISLVNNVVNKKG
jgi:hypothetical protein